MVLYSYQVLRHDNILFPKRISFRLLQLYKYKNRFLKQWTLNKTGIIDAKLYERSVGPVEVNGCKSIRALLNTA